MRRQTRAGLSAWGAATACLVLGGCTSEPATDAPESSSAGPTASDEPASTALSPAPTSVERTTASQSPRAPSVNTPTSSTTTPRARTAATRARDAQIKAADLPGFNQAWAWDRHRTMRGAGRRLPPVCSVTSLVSIGGSVAYRTDYASSLSKDATAVQVTAVFPDIQTAITAEQVLATWGDRCQRRVRQQDLEDARVTAMSQVHTDAGVGRQWMTTYRPVPGEPDSTWFNAEGFVRSADMITYLVIRSSGQDYDYPPGEEPIANALQVAGRYLREQR